MRRRSCVVTALNVVAMTATAACSSSGGTKPSASSSASSGRSTVHTELVTTLKLGQTLPFADPQGHAFTVTPTAVTTHVTAGSEGETVTPDEYVVAVRFTLHNAGTATAVIAVLGDYTVSIKDSRGENNDIAGVYPISAGSELDSAYHLAAGASVTGWLPFTLESGHTPRP